MKPVIIIAIAFVLLIPVTAFAQSEREWITSGPFQIDRSEYVLGEKIFLRTEGLRMDEKGEVAFLRPLNTTHYEVYLTIPFDGSDNSAFNYYLQPELSKIRGYCSADDFVGDWRVIFRGTSHSNLEFKIIKDILPGSEEDYEKNVCVIEEEKFKTSTTESLPSDTDIEISTNTEEQTSNSDESYDSFLFNPQNLKPTILKIKLYPLQKSDVVTFDVSWSNEGKNAIYLHGLDIIYLKDNEKRTYGLFLDMLPDGTQCPSLDITVNPGLEKRLLHCFEIPKSHPIYFDLIVNSFMKSPLAPQTKDTAPMHWTYRDNFWENVETFKPVLEEITHKINNSDSGGGCLIATATYGSELAPQVQQLRELRDNSLLQTESGTSFMNYFNDFYYSFSPVIADYERENPVFKEMVKIAITPMVSSLSILNYVDMDSESSVLGYGISLIVLNGMMYVGIPIAGIVVIRKRF